MSSVGISFGGLVLRSMEVTDAWQINFYLSLALVTAITLIMVASQIQTRTARKGFCERMCASGHYARILGSY